MSEWISVNFAVPPDNRDVLVRTYLEWKNSNGKSDNYESIRIAQRVLFKNGKIK